MKTFSQLCAVLLCLGVFSYNLQADVWMVTTENEFEDALDSAAANDTIMWEPGVYENIWMEIERDDLVITCDELGSVIFTADSRLDIEGNNITIKGFQWLNGDIGTDHIIHARGSYNVFTELNIRDYISHKYLIIREESQYCVVSHSNFEHRVNQADQNILSILVDSDHPGFNKVQYCSFKNFDGSGLDEGVEPIRIGVSSQGEFDSRSLVEYCYFTQCNGDGEIISSKARQNVYRYNTFEDNPVSELVLRHGSENIVYGNFFLNGKGGVRVREGQDHYIYNNYFQGISDRPIYLMNDDADPLDNINIAFNTIIDCDELRLGGPGESAATNVTFANNIFTDPRDDNFRDATGTETWIGNFSSGDLGIPLPGSGITEIDPLVEENEAGYFGLNVNSPAINAATPGFAPLPQYEGMEPIDTDISLDLMGQIRPTAIEEKDLGCNEHPHNILIEPFATEANTGPSYDSSSTPFNLSSEIGFDLNVVGIELFPNPCSESIHLALSTSEQAVVEIGIYDMQGKLLGSIEAQNLPIGDTTVTKNIEDLPTGRYTLRVRALDGQKRGQKCLTFIKSQ